MTARQPWSGADYDTRLDRGLDQLHDERTTAEQEMQRVESTLSLLRQHAARGYWAGGEVERLCERAAERMRSIAELMDQEAMARP